MASKLTDYNAWEVHRGVIHTLYVVQNRRQDEVLEILKQPPFDLDATLVSFILVERNILINNRPAQFERILTDILRISKNLKGEDWVAIDYHKSKRKRQDGKETVVYINGVPQNPKKLQRQANRYRNRTSADRGK
jgi:Clr5-like protein